MVSAVSRLGPPLRRAGGSGTAPATRSKRSGTAAISRSHPEKPVTGYARDARRSGIAGYGPAADQAPTAGQGQPGLENRHGHGGPPSVWTNPNCRTASGPRPLMLPAVRVGLPSDASGRLWASPAVPRSVRSEVSDGVSWGLTVTGFSQVGSRISETARRPTPNSPLVQSRRAAARHRVRRSPAIPRSMSFRDTCVAPRYSNVPTFGRRSHTGAEAFELEDMDPCYIDIDGFWPKDADTEGPEGMPIANQYYAR